MAEQKVKLTDLPAATDTIDNAQLLINQNSTDQKIPVTHFLRAKNNLSDLADIGQARANLDVPSVDEVNDKLTGFIDGSSTFLAGASLASRTDFIWDEESKSWYYWGGIYRRKFRQPQARVLQVVRVKMRGIKYHHQKNKASLF
ncbi:hypothetical protein WMR29_001252 [Enterobacter hormaechei subsp. hoffmannii]